MAGCKSAPKILNSFECHSHISSLLQPGITGFALFQLICHLCHLATPLPPPKRPQGSPPSCSSAHTVPPCSPPSTSMSTMCAPTCPLPPPPRPPIRVQLPLVTSSMAKVLQKKAPTRLDALINVLSVKRFVQNHFIFCSKN